MLKLKVMPDGDEPYELIASTRDIAKWEKTTKGASFHQLQADMHVKDVYAVAYHAATRQGKFVGSLSDFMETVDFDILDDEEDGSEDPTRSAA